MNENKLSIESDHVDLSDEENPIRFIDVWYGDDDGMSIAEINMRTKEVLRFDKKYHSNPMVLKELTKILEESMVIITLIDHYHYHPVKTDADGDIERCQPDEARFWSVYFQDKYGLDQIVCDCITEIDAAIVNEHLNALLKAAKS